MTDKALDGKIALVTGASGGIGQAIAIHLAQAGAHVMVHYSGNKAAADKTVAAITDNGGKAQSVQADLRDPGAIDRLAGQVDTLDILVNNAGIADGADISATTRDQYDAVFDTNVKAMLFLTQALLPKLQGWRFHHQYFIHGVDRCLSGIYCLFDVQDGRKWLH